MSWSVELEEQKGLIIGFPFKSPAHVPFQHVHHKNTLELGKTITTGDDLTYFAASLSNEKNFVKHLDTILIPRTVGSANHKKVGEVESSYT